jgi:YbbR domain-containing protein
LKLFSPGGRDCGLKRMKREHKYKILALILSFILWYFVVWGKPIEKIIQVPIEPRLSSEGNYIVELNPSQVDVKLEATRSNLRNADIKNLKLQIDLTRYSPGVYQVRVPIESLKMNNIKIKEVTPSYIMVVIKKISSKKVPVKIQFNQKIVVKTKLLVEPSFVIVKGSWDDIKNINQIKTVPIELDELKKEKVMYVELENLENGVEIEPKKVKIVYLTR